MSFWLNLLFFRDRVLSAFNVIFGRLRAKLNAPHADLTGQVAIVTGANSGLGLGIAEAIAQRGAIVYFACRSESKAKEAIEGVLTRLPSARNRLKIARLDTSNLDSVREFAKNWSSHQNGKVDLLFHNAGIAKFHDDDDFSADHFELTYATNFLGSFLLTYLLESSLADNARIIFSASNASYDASFSDHFRLESVKGELEAGFHYPVPQSFFGNPTHKIDGSSRYAQTKAMQIVFAKMLQEHFDTKAKELGNRSKKIVSAFSPGFAQSGIQPKLRATTLAKDPSFFIPSLLTFLATSTEQGIATAIWLAVTTDGLVVGPNNGGNYWESMTRRISWGEIASNQLRERLWVRWEKDAGIEWR